MKTKFKITTMKRHGGVVLLLIIAAILLLTEKISAQQTFAGYLALAWAISIAIEMYYKEDKLKKISL